MLNTCLKKSVQKVKLALDRVCVYRSLLVIRYMLFIRYKKNIPYKKKLLFIRYKKMRVYCACFRVINAYTCHTTINAYTCHTRTMLYKWKACKEELRSLPTHCNVLKIRPNGASTVLPPEIESYLANWIRSYRSEGVPISNQMVQLRAK